MDCNIDHCRFYRFPIEEIRGGGDAVGGLGRVRGGLDVLDPANHFHPIAEQTPWYAIKEKYSKVDDLRTGLVRKRGWQMWKRGKLNPGTVEEFSC